MSPKNGIAHYINNNGKTTVYFFQTGCVQCSHCNSVFPTFNLSIVDNGDTSWPYHRIIQKDHALRRSSSVANRATEHPGNSGWKTKRNWTKTAHHAHGVYINFVSR